MPVTFAATEQKPGTPAEAFGQPSWLLPHSLAAHAAQSLAPQSAPATASALEQLCPQADPAGFSALGRLSLA